MTRTPQIGRWAALACLLAPAAPAWAEPAVIAQRLEGILDQVVSTNEAEAEAAKRARALITGRLQAAGFTPEHIEVLAKRIDLGDVQIESRTANVPGPDGVKQARKVFVFRVAPSLALRPQDLQGLVEGWMARPLPAHLACLEASAMLPAFRAVGVEAGDAAKVAGRVEEAWAGLLLQDLTATVPGFDPRGAGFVPALLAVLPPLRDFKAAFTQSAHTPKLDQAFLEAAGRYTLNINVSGRDPALYFKGVAEIVKAAAQVVPETGAHLREVSGFQWRRLLLALLEDPGTPLPALKNEYAVFEKYFKALPGFDGVRTAVHKRRAQVVAGAQLGFLEALADAAAEYDDLVREGAAPAALEGAAANLRGACTKLFVPENMGALPEIRLGERVAPVCGAVTGAGWAAVQARFEARRAQLEKAAKVDSFRAQKGALQALIEWSEALADVRFGVTRGYAQAKPFAALWAAGAEAPACPCGGYADFECRGFTAPGGAVTYHGVLKYAAGKLYEFELCGLLASGGGRAPHDYLATQFTPKFKPAAAAAFFAGVGTAAGAELAYGRGDLQVALRRAGDFISAAARSQAQYAAYAKLIESERQASRDDAKRARAERVRKGWETGACVQWNCTPECSTRGRVKLKAAAAYTVTIVKDAADYKNEGRNVQLAPSDLYDCP